MKKLFVLSSLVTMLLSSCATQKMSTYQDDVYANPKEDRIEEARLAAIAKQQKEASDKRYNDSIAAVRQAQKEKDDANPYYQDREFKYDDYYDYEYATRVRRFNNGINGLSYYDNYYTNSYWYSGNPYNYGVSVYNGYSWWGSSYNSYSYNPSVAFYSNWGWGYGSQFGCYSGYNPYMAGYMQGYNNGFNNGYFGNYYGYGSPYGYGGYPYYGYGYGGFNNPYNNGWGYYNSYDNNSSYTYGPRSSHGGGNSRRTSNPGVNSNDYVKQYVSTVADQQDRAVKFAEVPPRKNIYGNSNENNNVPLTNPGNNTGGIKNPPVIKNDNNVPVRPVRGDNSIPTKDLGEPTFTQPVKNPIKNPGGIKDQPIETLPIKQTPIRNEPIRNETRPMKEFSAPVYQTPINNNNSPSTPGNNNNNGGGTPPANNGGHRPR